MWDYVPHVSYLLQATWTHDRCRIWSTTIARCRSHGLGVHAIIKSGTCAKATLSGRDWRAHRVPCGITRSAYHHQWEYRVITIRRPRSSRSLSHRGDVWTIRSSSRLTTAIDGLPGNSWGQSDLHQTVKMHSDLHLTLATPGLLWNVRSSSSRDFHRTAEKTRGRNPRSWHD